MKEVYFREITKEDLSTWERLARSEFLEKDFCSKEYLLERWETIVSFVLMTKEGEWIGCCFINKAPHSFNPKGIHFLESCVFPKFRGLGYGKYLVKLCFDNSIGFDKSACIDPSNDTSIRLLTKYGFFKKRMHKHWGLFLCDKNYYPKELENLNMKKIGEDEITLRIDQTSEYHPTN